MVAGEQLCVGASTELLTSLNGDKGSDWRQPRYEPPHTGAQVVLQRPLARPRC